jgi:hypothetical protein
MWEERTKPNTEWNWRSQLDTEWKKSDRVWIYITPLQDSYTEVADENNEVIMIIADSWKFIATTFWTPRVI